MTDSSLLTLFSINSRQIIFSIERGVSHWSWWFRTCEYFHPWVRRETWLKTRSLRLCFDWSQSRPSKAFSFTSTARQISQTSCGAWCSPSRTIWFSVELDSALPTNIVSRPFGPPQTQNHCTCRQSMKVRSSVALHLFLTWWPSYRFSWPYLHWINCYSGVRLTNGFAVFW